MKAREKWTATMGVLWKVLAEHFPMWFLRGYWQKVHGEARLEDRYNNLYVRLRIRCDNPSHGDCKTSKVVGKDVHLYGPRAAEGYLGAWLSASHRIPAADHRDRMRWRPSEGEIREYLDRHPAP